MMGELNVVQALDTTQAHLSMCDREPITRLERIQSFGFLLAKSHDWVITRASANLGPMLGIDAHEALGRPLDSVIDTEALHDIRNRMIGLSKGGAIERIYAINLVDGRPALTANH